MRRGFSLGGQIPPNLTFKADDEDGKRFNKIADVLRQPVASTKTLF